MWITGVEDTNLARNSTCSNNHAKRESCPKSWRANETKLVWRFLMSKPSSKRKAVWTKNWRISRPGILCFSFPTLSLPSRYYFFPPSLILLILLFLILLTMSSFYQVWSWLSRLWLMARISAPAAIKSVWDLSWKLNVGIDEVLDLYLEDEGENKTPTCSGLKLFCETSKKAWTWYSSKELL